MNVSADPRKRWSFAAFLAVLVGLALLVAAWMFPASLKSVSPALLRAAGEGTQSVSDFGIGLVDLEKPGPAALVLVAARSINEPKASALAAKLDAANGRQPQLVAWGGWDPFLDPLFNLRENKAQTKTTPILTFLLPEKARETLRAYLATSRSEAVLAVLKTHDVTGTHQFVAASKPGGQPLDAVILLTALLIQGEHFDPALQRELRGLAETASKQNALGDDLEAFYVDLLSLGQRLDWVQLASLLRLTADTHTVGEFAHMARVAPDQIPLIYTAALFSGSADRVATYLIQYGKTGIEDVRYALGAGQGALRELLQRQLPLSRVRTPELAPAAGFGLLHPAIALTVKWGAFLLGAFVLLRGLDRLFLSSAGDSPTLPHLQGGILAILMAGMLVLVTEPYLLKAAPPSEFKMRLVLPVLVAAAPSGPAPSQQSSNITNMDTSTLISIGIFAALQVTMYLICLMKIREVERANVPPLVKLKLMENEENLFDGGLYVGIGGTATALVLQVLGVIQPNLLAAYSSNLFGITCVALVKIRHVRPYKKQIILQAQEAIQAAARLVTA